MNEITKLYENAEIKPVIRDTAIGKGYYIEHQRIEEYPLFTAEKQIAIENIIFQCNFGVCELQRTMPAKFKDNKFIKHYFSWSYHAGDIGYYNEIVEKPYGDWDVEYSNPDRKEALAGFVNALWDEHLSEEEKQQIRKILE